MVPDFLTGLDRWVLWREESRNGRKTKLPFGVRGDQASDVTDKKNWGTWLFCQGALERAKGAWDGAGIVLGSLGDEVLIGLDLDSCLDEDVLADWAWPYLSALNTYAEVSPSGTGMKLFFRSKVVELPEIRAMFSIPADMNGRKKTYADSNGAAHGPAAEIYLSHRYFTVTGNQWHDAPEEVAIIGLPTLRKVADLFGPREASIAGNDVITDTTAPDAEALKARLADAMRDRPRLIDRWMGGKSGLTDASRSGFDMSLGAMLKAAGFSYGEMRAGIIANENGAGRDRLDDERYFQRIWINSVVPAKRPEEEPPEAHPDDPGYDASLFHEFVEYQRDANKETTAKKPHTASSRPEDQEYVALDPSRDWLAPAPLRQWLIDQWIPIGYVTGLYGDGGIGKSLLAQQLMTSTAVGMPWLGLDVRAGRVLGFMCEDDSSELHRRQEGINRVYGIGMENLENLRISARLGADNLLMTFDQENHGKLAPLFQQIDAYLEIFRPRLVVLDTLADIFGGNEINRAHARQFVQGVGGALARKYECAVVIPAHPSASGLSSGSGTSGSTAWNNTFRSRLYVKRPDDDVDGDTRLVSRMKANYAPKGGEITVTWQDGAFGTGEPMRPRPDIDWPDIEAIFAEIDRAWKAGDPWSSEPQSKRQSRYIATWASIKLGLNEKKVGRAVQGWCIEKYLMMQTFNAHKNARGLRVLRRLRPEWDVPDFGDS